MTISIAPARNEYTANAAQTIFNYTFKIFEDTDLNVYITPVGQVANDSTDIITAYTVTGLGDEDGGTITLTTGANANDLVTIVSNVPSSRAVNYQNNGDFRPETVNADFDRVVSIVKKIEDTANRTLLLEQSQQDPKPLTLPNPVASKFLRWKGDLSGVENATLTDADPVVLEDFLINDLSQAYAFKTVALMQASSITFPVGKKIFWQGYYAESDGGSNWGIVKSGAHTDDGGSVFTLADGKYIEANQTSKTNIRKWGAKSEVGFDNHDIIQALYDRTGVVHIPSGTFEVDSPLTIKTSTIYKISGVGVIYSILMFTYATESPAITVQTQYKRKLVIDGVRIAHKVPGNLGSGVLVQLLGGFWGAAVKMVNVQVDQFEQDSLRLDEAFSCEFKGCYFSAVISNTTKGVLLRTTATTTFGNEHNFKNCVFNWGKIGIVNDGASTLKFDTCTFESLNLFNASKQLAGLSVVQSYDNCWFENISIGLINAAVDEVTLLPILPVTTRATLDRFTFRYNVSSGTIPTNFLNSTVEPYWFDKWSLFNGKADPLIVDIRRDTFNFDNGLDNTDPTINTISQSIQTGTVSFIDDVFTESNINYAVTATVLNGAKMNASFMAGASNPETLVNLIGVVNDAGGLGNSYKIRILWSSPTSVTIQASGSGLTDVRVIFSSM